MSISQTTTSTASVPPVDEDGPKSTWTSLAPADLACDAIGTMVGGSLLAVGHVVSWVAACDQDIQVAKHAGTAALMGEQR